MDKKREAVLQRLRRRFEHIPADISLADELIAERRSAARAPGRPCRLDDDRATGQDADLDTEK